MIRFVARPGLERDLLLELHFMAHVCDDNALPEPIRMAREAGISRNHAVGIVFSEHTPLGLSSCNSSRFHHVSSQPNMDAAELNAILDADAGERIFVVGNASGVERNAW